MNPTKAVTDYTGETAAELGPIAQAGHDAMLAHAARFTNPPITMAAFQTLITDYDQKLVARASEATADIIAFNAAREALENAMSQEAKYVNLVADGDPAIVEEGGFPSYTMSNAPDTTPPNAPQDLRLRHGELSGTVVARYRPERPNSTNEVQVCTGDPNVEANWQTKGIFKSGKAQLGGLTPGAVIWVRVRSVGLKGVMGVWSDVAEIRVL